MNVGRPPLDPRLERIEELLREREPPEGDPGPGDPGEGVTAAAVSLVLRPGDPETELLLIKRARSDRDPWSGHMALPGGRKEPGDPDLVATAGRETEEETGIPLLDVGRRMGRLEEVRPSSSHLPRLAISPFVFGVPAGTDARPEPGEVEAVFWVPLPHFLDPVQRREALLELRGVARPFRAIQVGTEVVWGLTHRILDDFLPVVRAVYGDARGSGDGLDGAP